MAILAETSALFSSQSYYDVFAALGIKLIRCHVQEPCILGCMQKVQLYQLNLTVAGARLSRTCDIL